MGVYDWSPLSVLGDLLGAPDLLAAMCLGVPIGMVFGALPGLGGKLALAVTLPLVVGADPVAGAVFLLSLHAVVHTGSAIPSILLGIPGTGPSAATILDGYPMARRGDGARALAASLAASAVGGAIGALVLAVLMPVVGSIILAFGVGEFFLLTILGIVLIGTVSGARLIEGVLVGLLGLMVAFVGLDPLNALPRYTFGQLELWDGVDVLTAVVGIMAVPEMLALAQQKATSGSASLARSELRGMLMGCRDVVTHRWLVLRTSMIGALVGLVPGLGGDAASWVCYGHAIQTSTHPEKFGQGAVEGVIAPEAANNAKEGGALLPTLCFGVPGSSGMALLLGGFVMLGITPGPQLLVERGDLVWTLIWTLVLANLLGVVAFLALLPLAAPVLRLGSTRLFPVALSLAAIGALLSAGHTLTLVLLFLFGLLGWVLKRASWPRAPFVIGLVLGPLAETSLHQALLIWGPGFLLRPLALVLLGLIAACVAWDTFRRRQRARAAAGEAESQP